MTVSNRNISGIQKLVKGSKKRLSELTYETGGISSLEYHKLDKYICAKHAMSNNTAMWVILVQEGHTWSCLEYLSFSPPFSLSEERYNF